MKKSASFILGFRQGTDNALTEKQASLLVETFENFGSDSNIEKEATLRALTPAVIKKLLGKLGKPKIGRPLPPPPYPGFPFPQPKKLPYPGFPFPKPKSPTMPPGAMDF
jgi:hypothetical protein